MPFFDDNHQKADAEYLVLGILYSSLIHFNFLVLFSGDPQSRGLISITAEFIKETRSRLHLHLGASKLDKKGLLSTKKVFKLVIENVNRT